VPNAQNQTDPHSRPTNRGDIKINGSDPFDFEIITVRAVDLALLLSWPQSCVSNVQNQADPHSCPANRGDIQINGSDPFDSFDSL
jgi:hypothetical protein